MGGDVATLSVQMVLSQFRGMNDDLYPRWSQTKELIQEVADQVVDEQFHFKTISSLLASAGDSFFHLENQQCQITKSTLLSMEERKGNGRIRLGDFYRPVMEGEDHEFSESVDFLRQLGALDESVPGVERVIIPNYLLAPSNCVADSGYYAVCCKDECEGLMDHLEAKIQAPIVSPSEILKLVAEMPSASPNRTLTNALKHLLQEVADLHGGEVPLHGRLFAQWMHFAYPRECPFPHLSGTIEGAAEEAFSFKALGSVGGRAKQEEMREFIDRPVKATENNGLCSAMWSFEEELLDQSPNLKISSLWDQLQSRSLRLAAASLAVLAAILSKLSAVWRKQIL